MLQVKHDPGAKALLLTVLSILAQGLGFFYRVALSRAVGAEVMGLYQLLMPAYGVMLSLTAVGLTACTSNLSAQYLALGNGRGLEQTRRLCLILLALGCALLAGGVVGLYDPISVYLLGDARTQLGLVLLLPCVLLTGVENLHKHVFYGAGRVCPPALAELAEQGVRTGAVLGLLWLFLPQNAERTVGLIVAGMVVCEVFSALTLTLLYRKCFSAQRKQGRGEPWSLLLRRVGGIALPVSISSLLGNLMSAANAALIPRKLVEGGMGCSEAMSAFGVVCGMSLPMLTLPTVLLGALNLVMVPALARSAALEQWPQVRRQAQRGLAAAAVTILPALAMLTVLGGDLAAALYQEPSAGEGLLPLTLAVVCSCGHGVFAGILNGVGKQGRAALIALVCDGVQLAFVCCVPVLGMKGYVAGLLVSELLGALLCAWQVKRSTGMRLLSTLLPPGLAALLMGLTANLLFRHLKDGGMGAFLAGALTLGYGFVLYLAALQAQGVSLRKIFGAKRHQTQR